MDSKDKHDLPSKNRKYSDSFRYAFQGVKTAFQEERNMRTHVLTGIFVVTLSLFLDLSRDEWLWLILVSYLVFVMELINTVVENLVDLVTEDYHPIAKKVKDMAAAVVLVTASFAAVIGVIILLPKLLQILR
ncbi:diacylglycerol kinase (ATP) [Alkalibacterium subtropicum]|uniref:Diacylglycerol kinase (ATP) n=1 Tax=Alkalibacterium subtropicum TaxID=753702 RepID=A0A1I1JWI5_9LACT|nr:diacylglycerol kinase family protein [Alkalibacterium subtropicum]SFC52944.1 diacylglycerol kinase (ATP) [Alkalibacterium subtropicum]